jgi:hypothetical protein
MNDRRTLMRALNKDLTTARESLAYNEAQRGRQN